MKQSMYSCRVRSSWGSQQTQSVGDALPSVRQLADTVESNMHTVNKAYSILRQEGFIQLDRRRGAVVAIDADKAQAMLKLRRKLAILLAKDAARISAEKMYMHW